MGSASSIQRLSLDWESMRKTGLQLATSVDVYLIADQDKQSRRDESGDGHTDTWVSSLITVRLTRRGAQPNHKYTMEVVDKTQLHVQEHDGSDRGAEFSSLCFFNGKLLTCDDRTGKIFSLVKTADLSGAPQWTLQHEFTCCDGDGSDESQGFKAEWMTVKDDLLYVGSHGRMQSFSGAADRMRWVKVVDKNYNIEHVNWGHNYDMICRRLEVDTERGYVVHEAGLWSDIHQKWFFFPRRVGHEAYDPAKDAYNGANFLLAVNDNFTHTMARNVLDHIPTHGCADLDFMPISGQAELIVVRTVEVGDNMCSYLSVIDLDGKVLMKEEQILNGLKLEGLAANNVRR